MAAMRRVLLIDGPAAGGVISMAYGAVIRMSDKAIPTAFGGFHEWTYDIFTIKGRNKEFEFGIGVGGVNEIMRALIAYYVIAKDKGFTWHKGEGVAIGGHVDGEPIPIPAMGVSNYNLVGVNDFKLYVPIGRDLDFALESLWQRYVRPAPANETDTIAESITVEPEFTTRDALDIIAKALGQDWCIGAEREPADSHRGYAAFLVERIQHDFIRKGSLPDLEASLGEAKRLVDQFSERVKAAAIEQPKAAVSIEARVTLLETEYTRLRKEFDGFQQRLSDEAKRVADKARRTRA